MEVKIGVAESSRELVVSSGQAPDEVEALVTEALRNTQGLLTLVDPETGRLLEVQTGKKELRDSYAEAAAKQRAEIAAALRRAGAGHLQLRTDRDWLIDMVRFVAARRRGASGGALR